MALKLGVEHNPDVYYYEEGVALNLSQLFGRGKEPDAETVRILLKEYSIVDIKAGKTPFLAQAA